jgi:hypothetical protein
VIRRLARPRIIRNDTGVFVPADPRAAVAGPLDPDLEEIRGRLRPFGRRLWFRRIVRRTWLVVAAVVAADRSSGW